MLYRIGLDIGITSVGWAVIQNDEKGEPIKIVDLGVRIFDKAENPKTGASLAAPRREARSARRRTRRRKHRLDRIKLLLEKSNIISLADIEIMYSLSVFEKDVYQLRYEGLSRLLNNEELTRVLIHLAKRRGYKSNSKSETSDKKGEEGKALTAISQNVELMKTKDYQTVGEMLYKDEKFRLKVNEEDILINNVPVFKARNTTNDYKFTIARDMILEEIQILLKKQREYGNALITENFAEEYIEIFYTQRNFDEGPGKQSPFGGNMIEKMLGKCTFEKEPPEPRTPKACYTFEYFKLLQDINHLRIRKAREKARDLTREQMQSIIQLAHKKDSINYSHLRKELQLIDDEYFNILNYQGKDVKEIEDKAKFNQMQSFHRIRKALDKVQKNYISQIPRDTLDEIGRILSLYKSDTKRVEKLSQLNLLDEYIEQLLKLNFSGTAHLSLKAMQKIIPQLEEGMTYDKACALVYVDHRGIEVSTKKKRLHIDDIEPITNPVVKRAVAQTIKVVNSIVKQYGPPQLVCIELAREMGKSREERNKIEAEQKKNFERNDLAREQVFEYKKSKASGEDIVKFKLWEEQNGICLYSGESLVISRLFEPGYADVDHVIPYSISFNDSYRNKVLVKSAENRQKGNRLPYEYMKINTEKLKNFIVLVEGLIKDTRKREILLKQELSEEDIEGFIERNLNDTKYISKAVYNLINKHLEFSPSKFNKKPVRTVNGSITSYVRKRLALSKLRTDGDLHHAVDATVIACITDGMIQKISRFHKNQEVKYISDEDLVDIETGEVLDLANTMSMRRSKIHFPEPWHGFYDELNIRLSPDVIDLIEENKPYNYDGSEIIRPVFVSRMPRRSVKGNVHKDTIRSAKKSGYSVSKKLLTELKLKNGEIEGYYNKQSDTLLYNALLKQLEAYSGNAKEAFKEPFFKPRADGSPGPLVKKVKIFEKSTLNVPVNEGKGIASNGRMLRIDIFHVKNQGYYFVPIYLVDTLKKELPNKAVASKDFEDWKEMKEEDFVFSLYPNDLIKILHKDGFKVKKKAEKDINKTVKNCFMYYVKASISTASLYLITPDNSYEQESLGIKSLLKLEKYHVDVLGNINKVNIPEVRVGFNNRDKKQKYK